MFSLRLIPILFSILILNHCAETLAPDTQERPLNPGVTCIEGEITGYITRDPNGDNPYEVQVNASCNNIWIYLDLDADEQVASDDPDWDIAFRRFVIKTNSGVSGSGGVETMPLLNTGFASVTIIPSPFIHAGDDAEWVSPPAGSACVAVPKSVFMDVTFSGGNACWLDYGVVGSTILSPRNTTYVVKSTSGRYFRIRVTDYYSETGTSGFFTLLVDEL